VQLAALGAVVAFLLAAALRGLLATEAVLAPAMLVAGAVSTGLMAGLLALPLLGLLRRALGPEPEGRTAGVVG